MSEYALLYDQARLFGITVGVLFMMAAIYLRYEFERTLNPGIQLLYLVAGAALVGISNRAYLGFSPGAAFAMLLSFAAIGFAGALGFAWIFQHFDHD